MNEHPNEEAFVNAKRQATELLLKAMDATATTASSLDKTLVSLSQRFRIRDFSGCAGNAPPGWAGHLRGLMPLHPFAQTGIFGSWQGPLRHPTQPAIPPTNVR
ncbi:MAG: hypothetical protein AAB425_08450 [Bdellovibrionota bacterium]